MDTHRYILSGLVGVGIGILLMFGFRSCGNSEIPNNPIVLHDTVRVTDTLRIAGKTKTLYVTKWDTIREIVTDTLTNTEYAVLPIEQKEYRDTFATDSSRIELGVQFSGYNAKIDNIDLQYTFTVEPRTIVKKRGWGQFVGVGVGAGYGASVVGNQVFAAPQIGVSVVYGFGYHF